MILKCQHEYTNIYSTYMLLSLREPKTKRLRVKEMVNREYERHAYSISHNPRYWMKSSEHGSKFITGLNTQINSQQFCDSAGTVLVTPILQGRSLKLRQAQGTCGHLQGKGRAGFGTQAVWLQGPCSSRSLTLPPKHLAAGEERGHSPIHSPNSLERLVSYHTYSKTIQIVYFSE